jgi:hypothetical protein
MVDWVQAPARALFLYSTANLFSGCSFSFVGGGVPILSVEARFLHKQQLCSILGRILPLICSVNMTSFVRALPRVSRSLAATKAIKAVLKTFHWRLFLHVSADISKCCPLLGRGVNTREFMKHSLLPWRNGCKYQMIRSLWVYDDGMLI